MVECNYTVVSKVGFNLRQPINVDFVVRGNGTIGNCWLGLSGGVIGLAQVMIDIPLFNSSLVSVMEILTFS